MYNNPPQVFNLDAHSVQFSRLNCSTCPALLFILAVIFSKLYEILKKAQNGSEEHVIELYNKFLPLIKGYGRKLNYEEAESDLIIFLLEYIIKPTLINLEIEVMAR